MSESYPQPTSDDRVNLTEGQTPSLADPRATTGDQTSTALSSVPARPSLRYQMLDEIARGGMGVIYRAIDTALGREVAVKVLQDKFDPDSGVARRFADEARITAQLQHPAIPPVHDLGTLPDGRPFLAMKLIKGQTLEEWLRARSDPSSERGRFLAVFEQVCQAVAYAHAHGVLHRDLKPANVMVGAFGEVQLMDWGLAKILASRERPQSEGSSPASREHPQPETDSALTRAETEVVGLRDSDGSFTQVGSVLGTPAYMPPEQAVGAVGKVDQRSDVFGLGAILAVILTGKPPFAAATAETTRLMAAQGDVAECLARLDGSGAEPELVALCKRCLSPKAAERPACGGAVAEAVAQLRAAADERARRAELERVQAEAEKAAVEARALERRKRRRLGLGAAAALVLAALGGLSAVLAVQQRANAELATKNDELSEEQRKVQQRFELAQKAIATFHTGVSEDVLLRNDQFKELRTRLLKEAAGFYADLDKLLEGQTDAKSRRLLAEGYFQLGQLTAKIGSQPEALAVHRQALAVRRELAAAADADVETRLNVAQSLRAVGLLLRALGDRAGARAAHEEQRDITAALEAKSPTDTVRALLAQSHHNIGILLTEARQPAEALAAYQKAAAIRQQLIEANPAVPDYQRDLANSNNNIAAVLVQTRKLVEALAVYDKTLAIREKLADDNPANTDFQGELAANYYSIGILRAQLGKPAEALAAHEKGLVIKQKLADANLAVTDFQNSLAWSHYHIGNLQSRLGKLGEALSAHEKARTIREKLADANPAIPAFPNALAWSYHNIGVLQSQRGNLAEALAAHEKARAIRQKLADTNPTAPEFSNTLASSHQNIGWILARLGKTAEALAAHEKVLTIRQKLADANPTIPDFQSELAGSLYYTGRLLARLGRFDEALAALDRGQALFQKLADAHPDNATFTLRLGYSHAFRGAARARAGQFAEAAADLRKALDLWSRTRDPDAEDHFERARALAVLAGLGAEGKSGVSAAEAAAFADQAVAALQDALQAGWDNGAELKEPDFDPLRQRADFQKLVKDRRLYP
jgi:serine/threonine protein kinase/tetratricopeptide (TPR) repeat protein